MGSYLSKEESSYDSKTRKELIDMIKNQRKQLQELIGEARLNQLDNELKIGIKENIYKPISEICLDCIKKEKIDKNYEYLVLSGGSIKGVCYLGSFNRLNEMGILYDKNGKLKFKGVAGTSVGSIAASMLAIGLPLDEINKIIFGLDMEKVFDKKFGWIRNLYNLLFNYGVAPGSYIDNFLADVIKKKTGDENYTIQQLYNDKGVKLVIVATNLNEAKTVYFYPNAEDKKLSDIPIKDAVRMSISIPFVFEPVKYHNNEIVDGGVLDNYPLHVFDGKEPGCIKARLNLVDPNPKVLGINIMTSENVESYDYIKRQEIKNIGDFSSMLIHSFMAENQRRLKIPSYWIRTLNIITPNFPVTQFALTKEQKEELIALGEKYTDRFFAIDNGNKKIEKNDDCNKC